MTPPYVLGVDGGGTGCRAALADASGQVLATGTAGPANVTSDFDTAVENVRAAIAQTGASADTPAHIGLAGIVTPDDGDRFATALGHKNARLTDDRPTMLAGALGGNDGLLAAIGTGSFVGASQGGHSRFLGGWGWRLGDQASGAWLGKTFLQQIMLSHDGLAPASPLATAVLGETGGPSALVRFAATATAPELATFAPRIVAAAQEDDPLAADLMSQGAAYLTRALTKLDPGPETPVCLTGGLGPAYAAWLGPALANRVTPPAGTALDGALILARAT